MHKAISKPSRHFWHSLIVHLLSPLYLFDCRSICSFFETSFYFCKFKLYWYLGIAALVSNFFLPNSLFDLVLDLVPSIWIWVKVQSQIHFPDLLWIYSQGVLCAQIDSILELYQMYQSNNWLKKLAAVLFGFWKFGKWVSKGIYQTRDRKQFRSNWQK